MYNKELLKANLIFIIIASLILIFLSFVSTVAFTLIATFVSMTNNSIPKWYIFITFINYFLAVLVIVGASLNFKFKKTAFVILLISSVLSLIVPIAFGVLVNFKFSGLRFAMILLIPTVMFIIATIRSYMILKETKIQNNLNEEMHE